MAGYGLAIFFTVFMRFTHFVSFPLNIRGVLPKTTLSKQKALCKVGTVELSLLFASHIDNVYD